MSVVFLTSGSHRGGINFYRDFSDVLRILISEKILGENMLVFYSYYKLVNMEELLFVTHYCLL